MTCMMRKYVKLNDVRSRRNEDGRKSKTTSVDSCSTNPHIPPQHPASTLPPGLSTFQPRDGPGEILSSVTIPAPSDVGPVHAHHRRNAACARPGPIARTGAPVHSGLSSRARRRQNPNNKLLGGQPEFIPRWRKAREHRRPGM